MNKIHKILLGLILISQPVWAQIDGNKLEFGLGITPTVSWISPDTKLVKKGPSEFKFGFGARINYKLSAKYAFGVEVNLQNIAANTHFDKMQIEHQGTTYISNDFNLEYDLRYLDIPVLLKMKTEPSGNHAFYGEFGAALSFLLDQRANVASDVLDISQVNTDAPEDGDMFTLYNPDNGTTRYAYNINKFKSGLIFGGGYHFIQPNQSRVELGIRYTLGLTDIYDEEKWKGTSQAISVNLGFIF